MSAAAEEQVMIPLSRIVLCLMFLLLAGCAGTQVGYVPPDPAESPVSHEGHNCNG
jgi:hypothetical protein